MSAPLRLLIVARSAVVRAGLEALLADESGLLVVAGAAPGASVADAVERHRPDVVLLDRASDDDDRSAASWMLEPDAPPVVMLVDLDDDAGGASVLRTLPGGVRAILPRESSPATIGAAVRAASAGLVALPASMLGVVLAPLSSDVVATAPVEAADRAPPSLTPREVAVLALLAEGLGNKGIAARLAISEHTVKFHLASIYAKLRVSTRTEAVMAGARRGLVMV